MVSEMKTKEISPDGSKRARRNGMRGLARMAWYAKWRSMRWNLRYGI